jgi:phosphohistidine phosphatase
MKRLLLLRHAKSSWDHPGLADFDRPLNERGLRAAPLMGRFLLRRKIRPDLVLSSPAERARSTAALVSEAAELDAPTRYDERIYEATAERLLEVVSQTEDGVEELLLVGHNPGMEELIELLAGERPGMPTAALARINLGVEKWGKVRAGAGRLELHVRPRDLQE